MKTICIIGAGAAGGYLAGQLSKSSSIIVKLIDVDNLNEKFDKSNTLESNNIGDYFGTNNIRGFGYGGSSNLWHGVITKLEDSDLDELDYTENKILKKEIKNAYKNLSKHICGSNLLENDELYEYGDNLSESIFNLRNYKNKVFVVQTKPFRTRKFLNKLAKENRIKFIQNSVALELISDENDNNKIKQVKIYNKQLNNIEYIDADEFVISAGSLESPRLLLQSIDSKSLVYTNNNIGKNLIDHPWCILGEFISKNSDVEFSNSDIRIGRIVRARFGKLIPLNIGNKYTNNCIVLKPYISEDYIAFINNLKYIIYNFSYLNLIRLIFKMKKNELVKFIKFLLYEKFGIKLKTKKGLIFAYIDQKPSNSNVSLSGTYDCYGRNIPNINWNITNYDMKLFSTIQKMLANNVNEKKYIFNTFEINKNNIITGCHFAGTAKIGSSSLDSVVDYKLKIHGIDNAYICDLSIFNNFGNSNPTYTLFAFAHRLANYLK